MNYKKKRSTTIPFTFFKTYFLFVSQRAGAVFPERTERPAPIFTPPQTHPLTSYPQNLRNPDYQQEVPESSANSDLPTLRYTYFFYISHNSNASKFVTTNSIVHHSSWYLFSFSVLYVGYFCFFSSSTLLI